MLRDGPIPAFAHGVIEYVAGVVFIIAPFVFGFDSGAAVALSIIVGVAVITLTASSDLPTGLMKQISKPVHVAADFFTAVLLIASPFIFSFSDETAPTIFFIVLGLVHLLVTIGTRFRPPRASESSS